VGEEETELEAPNPLTLPVVSYIYVAAPNADDRSDNSIVKAILGSGPDSSCNAQGFHGSPQTYSSVSPACCDMAQWGLAGHAANTFPLNSSTSYNGVDYSCPVMALSPAQYVRGWAGCETDSSSTKVGARAESCQPLTYTGSWPMPDAATANQHWESGTYESCGCHAKKVLGSGCYVGATFPGFAYFFSIDSSPCEGVPSTESAALPQLIAANFVNLDGPPQQLATLEWSEVPNVTNSYREALSDLATDTLLSVNGCVRFDVYEEYTGADRTTSSNKLWMYSVFDNMEAKHAFESSLAKAKFDALTREMGGKGGATAMTLPVGVRTQVVSKKGQDTPPMPLFFWIRANTIEDLKKVQGSIWKIFTPTRAEPGCLRYDQAYPISDRSEDLFVLEVFWLEHLPEAQDAHMSSPWMNTFFQEAGSILTVEVANLVLLPPRQYATLEWAEVSSVTAQYKASLTDLATDALATDGCLRFDVYEEYTGADRKTSANKVWMYSVFTDEEAKRTFESSAAKAKFGEVTKSMEVKRGATDMRLPIGAMTQTAMKKEVSTPPMPLLFFVRAKDAQDLRKVEDSIWNIYDPTRAEKGCLRYDQAIPISASRSKDDLFVLEVLWYEKLPDSQQAHMDSAHMATWFGEVGSILTSDWDGADTVNLALIK